MQTKRYLFKPLKQSDTCWDIAKGYDGTIYVGACSEHTAGGIGELVKFEPPTEALSYVANMAEVTGETVGDTHAPQGKIHLSLSPSREGFVYGSTHCTTPPAGDTMWDPWAMYMDARRCFLGAHLYRYDPNSDDVVDFGVVTPHEGVSLMMLDENVQRLFAVTYPRSHLFSWNLKGRDIVDLGRVSEHYVLAFAQYDARTIFFSDYYGRLLSVNPLDNTVRFHEVKLTHPPYNEGMRNWMSHALVGPDGWVYAGMYSYPNLIRFRPEKDKIVIEDLGPGLDELSADRAGGEGGTAGPAGAREEAVRFAFANGSPVGLILKGQTLYYAQLVYLGPKEFVGAYIASYDLETGRKRLVGTLEQKGFKPLVWKGVLGDDERLYWADFDAAPPSLWAVSV
jgi:hypothetical protein